VIKVKRSSSFENVKELGEMVANEVLNIGGEQILKEIRQQL
jgi:hypothetical protein